MKTSKKNIWYIIVIVLIVSTGILVLLISQNTNSSEKSDNDNIYQTNANGQSYGYAETTSLEQLPDLIPAVGKNGIEAYMRKEDYLGENDYKYEVYTVKLTDEELEFAREQYNDQYPEVSTVEFYKKCFDIPLFDVTGEEIVDHFTMSMGYYPYT